MTIDQLYTLYLDHPVISTDTRQILAGSLFFALKGERFDGNDFAAEALRQGAAYAIVSDPGLKGSQYLQVPDTLNTLQDLANTHRRHLGIPVLAITGSNGKTTTKELVLAVLSSKFKTHATQGNLNNHIGVPLTLLQAGPQTEIVICEMGANHGGEIAALCTIADPTHGLITNIGKAHLEGFGSLEGVKKAKGELYTYLESHEGFVFVNADDPALWEISQQVSRKISYGLKDDVNPDIHFRYVAHEGTNGFILEDRSSTIRIHSGLFGFYNASNVLAAFCIGRHFGVEENQVLKALSTFTSGANRSEKVIWKDCTIIKDAYNANPSSMELAVQAFGELYPDGWVILGDMKELGSSAPAAHQLIIQQAVKGDFQKIFLVGTAFREAWQFLQLQDPRIHLYENIEALIGQWNWETCRGNYLLIKGSRSMHLEKLLE